MPSSKKKRGKERKERQKVHPGTRSSVMNQNNVRLAPALLAWHDAPGNLRCNHGYQHGPSFGMVAEGMLHYIRVIEEQCPLKKGRPRPQVATQAQIAVYTARPLLSGGPVEKEFVGLLIGVGTNLLLAGRIEDARLAFCFATFLLSIDMVEPATTHAERQAEESRNQQAYRALSELELGGKRPLVEYFAGLIQCNCLSGLLEEQEEQQQEAAAAALRNPERRQRKVRRRPETALNEEYCSDCS